MTHGLSPRLFVENGPTQQVELAQASRSTARSWHLLDADRRFALIERILHPANDIIDEFPVAL